MEALTNCIAIVFIVHFCWSYYWNCYRRGYTMDVWHFSLLNLLVIVHVMLPFSRSDLNIFALGGLLRRTQQHVTEAYLISALGYLGVLIGGSLWRFNLGLGIRRICSRAIEKPTRAALFLLNSRTLLLAHAVVALSLSVGLVLYYFKVQGFGFNLGGMVIQRPSLRPLVQFTVYYSILIGSYALARFYALRERSMLIVCLLVMLTQLFFGGRNNLFSVISMTALVFIVRSGRKIGPLKFAAGITFCVTVGMLLDSLRKPHFSLSVALLGVIFAVFYGNTFSDTRDFAIVLSFWDGHYFHGLTYLAASFAFVPRYISTFRDTWSIGVVTATLAGFSPLEHAGLRVGTFGEAFLNFGLPGVVALSLMIGAVTRLIDLRMKEAIRTLPKTDLKVFSYLILTSFIGVVINSSTAASLYAIILLILFSYLLAGTARFLKIAI